MRTAAKKGGVGSAETASCLPRAPKPLFSLWQLWRGDLGQGLSLSGTELGVRVGAQGCTASRLGVSVSQGLGPPEPAPPLCRGRENRVCSVQLLLLLLRQGNKET